MYNNGINLSIIDCVKIRQKLRWATFHHVYFSMGSQVWDEEYYGHLFADEMI